VIVTRRPSDGEPCGRRIFCGPLTLVAARCRRKDWSHTLHRLTRRLLADGLVVWQDTIRMLLHRMGTALYRAALLACPRCGARTLFSGPFSMHETCAICHLVFEREPGYFIGAIYINYAATTLISIAGFLLLDAYTSISLTAQLLLWSVFGIGFPLLFYRYSKSLWLAIDHFLSPQGPDLQIAPSHRR